MKNVTIQISDDLFDKFQLFGQICGKPLSNTSIRLMLEMGCHLYFRIILAMLAKEDAE